MRLITTAIVVLLFANTVRAAEDADKLLGAWAAEVQGGGKMTLTFSKGGMLTNELKIPGAETMKISLRYSVSGNKLTFIAKGKEDTTSTITLKGKELTIQGGIFAKEGTVFTKQ